MRLYLDTEFNEYGGKLISLALVPTRNAQSRGETVREFYEVVEIHDPLGPWVREHVMPNLGKPALALEWFHLRLQTYLSQCSDERVDAGLVTIVADWFDDFKYLMGACLLGPGIAISTPPLALELRRDLNAQRSAIPHHALHDARALRDMDIRP